MQMTDTEMKQSQIDAFNADIEELEAEKVRLLGYVNATEGALMYAKGKRDALQAQLDGGLYKTDPPLHEPVGMADIPESPQASQNGAESTKAIPKAR